MVKFLTSLAMFIALLSAGAYDLHFSPTLGVNVTDQVRYVMPERGIFVPKLSQVERGQVFHFVIAVAIKKPLTEPLKLTASLQVKNPDGSIGKPLRDTIKIDLPIGARGVYFANKQISGEFDAADKSGAYSWIMTARDAAGKTKSASASLTLVDSISDKAPMNKAEFNKFMMNYYRDPKPERLMAALNYFFTGGEAEIRAKNKNYDPRHILHGFAELFKLNKQFHDDLARATVGVPEPHQLYYALIFAGLGKEAVMAQKDLIDPLVQVQIGQFTGGDPLKFSAVRSPVHLDMLWAEFFVTGRFEPVSRIVGELKNREGISLKAAREKVKSGQKLSDAEKRETVGRLIQIAAAWSLEQNLRGGHRQMGYYLETILRRKLYKSEDIAGNLVAIIKKVRSTPRSKK